MGHRHLFSTSQMFENEHDQNWNHMHATEQRFMHLGIMTLNAFNYYFLGAMIRTHAN
jgi:hypothetical protein